MGCQCKAASNSTRRTILNGEVVAIVNWRVASSGCLFMSRFTFGHFEIDRSLGVTHQIFWVSHCIWIGFTHLTPAHPHPTKSDSLPQTRLNTDSPEKLLFSAIGGF
jgi:hypothetical protein